MAYGVPCLFATSFHPRDFRQQNPPRIVGAWQRRGQIMFHMSGRRCERQQTISATHLFLYSPSWKANVAVGDGGVPKELVPHVTLNDCGTDDDSGSKHDVIVVSESSNDNNARNNNDLLFTNAMITSMRK
jgi:hypothetical protein